MMGNKRRSVVDSIPSSRCYTEYEYEQYNSREEVGNCCHRHRCCLITVTSILLLFVVVFIVVFVLLPVIFMLSEDVQHNLIFSIARGNHENDFTNFKKYGIEGVRNLYIPLDENISIGVWHVLPLEDTFAAVEIENFDYGHVLRASKYPILLYFHDSAENRITSKNKYLIFRRFFHVIAFDYRCFGDSSCGTLKETEIVNDAKLLYQWLRSETERPVYFWGHGLGAAVATRTIRELRKVQVVPTGLFLENAFTNLEEEVLNFPYIWVFSWLPWFKGTVIEPLKSNDLSFQTDEYLLSVDCPIMILHAEDDEYVPYSFSEKAQFLVGRRLMFARLFFDACLILHLSLALIVPFVPAIKVIE
ncbi:hypothetical protein FQR65_LT01323 [Abscondita terminalis]|nr:hypothetical protein FQR65_LT01323 [Abscondita terminalis]